MAECLAAMAPEFDGDRRRSRRASVPAAIAQKGSASASALGQSDDEFAATWLDTGHVAGYAFAGTVLLSKADAEHTKALWETMATSSVIGRAIGRERWLCANLKNQDLLMPQVTLGSGTRKVHLYRRRDPALARFRIR